MMEKLKLPIGKGTLNFNRWMMWLKAEPGLHTQIVRTARGKMMFIVSKD